MRTILVTDEPTAWAFLSTIIPIMPATDYLSQQAHAATNAQRVINACNSYAYQTAGYYVSLLAEARLQSISPSVIEIQDALSTNLLLSISQQLNATLHNSLKQLTDEHCTMILYFGQDKESKYLYLAKKMHHFFPFPLIRIKFIKKKQWIIKELMPLSIQDIAAEDHPHIIESAKRYIHQHHSHSYTPPQRVYHLAILVNKSDKTAPSNEKALARFVAAAARLKLNVELITPQDAKRITQFDALFIRATTAVNHSTYRLARFAERHGLVVIDDPQSIVKCTNKVFLAELFHTHQVSTPPTQFISQSDTHLPTIEFPCILKKPDGSCSKGVRKIKDLATLKHILPQFFKTSDLVLVQPFIPTPFDWRIGIIDQKPLWACRYYMAKNHWQIVNWNCELVDDILIHDTVLIEDVPAAVLNLAVQAAQLIGNGLYGVDIKSVGDTNYVIEINDNPSINYGIEDKLIHDQLYETILKVFLQRLTDRTKSDYY